MATSGTTSDDPLDWVQFYHQNLSGQTVNNNNQTTTFGGDRATNVMVDNVTPTSASAPSPSSRGGGDDTSPGSDHLNPQGRVTKPSRKRSRASRRTPTTLVNTDAANFRAMVQRFTGGSVAAPFATVPQYPRASNISFGFGLNQQAMNSNSNVAHVQQQQQRQVHQQPQQQQHHHQQQQQYMFNSMNDNNHGAFLERSFNS